MNGRLIVRRPAADEDARRAAESIAKDNVRAAIRFVEAVQSTEELLLRAPGIGARPSFDHSALAGVRFHLVKGFRKYLIFYIPRSDGIEIVRVLHGVRDLEALFAS